MTGTLQFKDSCSNRYQEDMKYNFTRELCANKGSTKKIFLR